MKVLNIGSMNLDYVYTVDHMVQPGETESSEDMNVFLGGKGINQSMALAKAGAEVYHGGLIGEDGQPFLDACKEYGVNADHIKMVEGKTGHAIIQVSSEGENCIMLYQGSNFAVDKEYVDSVFSEVKGPGYVILQNEISELAYIIDKAVSSGFEVVLNASPYNSTIDELDLGKISWLFINEIEGAAITGKHSEEDIINDLHSKYNQLGIVLTLGSKGSVCVKGDNRVSRGIFKVPVVDTTGAGDTFTGYFVAALAKRFTLEDVVKYASAAAAIAVSAPGAAQSIPCWEDVENFLQNK